MKRIDHFQESLLEWFDHSGRKNLPWQQSRTPYRVWLSEIMLQQTQVATVIPFYQRFLKAFPEINTLASASLDEVLPLWAGLGYYSRARNLHRAAGEVVARYQGRLPADPDQLVSLPGIGRSTAGAIASLAFNRPAPILDGNVKRIWTRLHGIESWPGESKTEKLLWQLSEDYLPSNRCADYTQALMDFGATVCTRSKPNCQICPFQSQCQAFSDNKVNHIPRSKPTQRKPVATRFWLILQSQKDQFYLEKRPPAGIWGGLWAFPEWPSLGELESHCLQLGIRNLELKRLTPKRHTFSHFHLHYTPIWVHHHRAVSRIDDHPGAWLDPSQIGQIAAPTPVRKLLEQLGQAVTQ